jgi:hypothetical protein
MTSYLPLQVGPTLYRLRLTMAGQRKLHERWQEDTLTFLFNAAEDGDRLCDLLTQALSWPGNENPLTDGAAFYDLLVDEGWRGQAAFAGLVFDLAEYSGLLTHQQAQQLHTALNDAFTSAFSALERHD